MPRPIEFSDDTACAKAARGTSARFLERIFAADPLVCPDCDGPTRIVAFIEEPRVLRAIHEHLSLWDAPRPRPPSVAAVGSADFEYFSCGGGAPLAGEGRRGDRLLVAFLLRLRFFKGSARGPKTSLAGR